MLPYPESSEQYEDLLNSIFGEGILGFPQGEEDEFGNIVVSPIVVSVSSPTEDSRLDLEAVCSSAFEAVLSAPGGTTQGLSSRVTQLRRKKSISALAHWSMEQPDFSVPLSHDNSRELI